jgi:hypothetical protein
MQVVVHTKKGRSDEKAGKTLTDVAMHVNTDSPTEEAEKLFADRMNEMAFVGWFASTYTESLTRPQQTNVTPRKRRDG